MTKLGKLLVFVNLAFSVAMAAWALGIYTQRIDYVTPKASTDRPAGEVFRRQEQIKQLQTLLRGTDATDPKEKQALKSELAPYRLLKGDKPRDDEKVGGVENRWRLAYAQVRSLELERTANKTWYGDQLKKLIEGKDPARFLVYKKDMAGKEIKGEPELESIKGTFGLEFHVPRFQDYKGDDGKGLDPRDAALAALKKLQQDIDKELDKIGKLVVEDKNLTEQLSGIGGKAGLRGQVIRQEGRLKRADEEVKDLEPREINTLVESDILLKRQEQLKGRVKELESRTTSSK